MEHEDIYNGVKIKISTYSNAAGSWQATAQFASGPEKTLDLQGSFDSEQEAYRAALSKAIAEVDRARSLKGKP